MPESTAPHYRATRVPAERFSFAKIARKTRIRTSVGDRSSMVELQIVILAVAGSSPVGHPRALRARNPNSPNPKLQELIRNHWDLDLGIWDFRRQAAWHVRCLKVTMLNPAIVEPARPN